MSWPLVKLDDVATLLRGVTFSSDDSVGQPCENYLPVLRAGNIQEKLYMEEGLIWIPEDKIKENQKIKENDIVMCTSSGSADLVGKCAKSLSNWNGSFGAFCAGIRANPKKVDASYLYHFLCSPMFRAWTKKSSGANIKNIRISELGEFKLPLPPLEEQKRIAAILDKADAIRRKRQQAIKLADDFLRSVFLEMFGDPVTNPKGWEVSTIGIECAVKGGKRIPKGATLVKENTGFPYIKAGNIKSGKVTLEKLEYVTPDVREKIKRYIVREGDICITVVGANIGDIGVVPRELNDASLTENANKILIKDNKRIDSHYLSASLQMDYIQNQIQSKTMAVGVPKLAIFRIEELEILVPPLYLQKAFGEKIKIIQSVLEKLVGSIGLHSDMFGSLSQKAFSGR